MFGYIIVPFRPTAVVFVSECTATCTYVRIQRSWLYFKNLSDVTGAFDNMVYLLPHL